MCILTTPHILDESIQRFCEEICSDFESQKIPVVADSQSIPNECFQNVRTKIQKCGGNIIYGWMIWVWDGVLIQAEYHSVWKSHSGQCLDVTVKPDGEQYIIFVEDSSIVYSGQLVNSKYKNISGNPAIDYFISCSNMEFKIKDALDRGMLGGNIIDDTMEILMAMQNMKKMIIEYMGNESLMCPCGCGREFKDHGLEDMRVYIEKISSIEFN